MKSFSTTQIPIFFSQYGCNLGTCGTRLFQETTAILSPAMTPVFSGGIAYEFYDSPDIQSSHWGYGLVRDEDAALLPVGRGLTLLPDYASLKARLAAAAETLAKQSWRRESGGEKGSVAVAVAGIGRRDDIPPLSAHWKAGHALPYSVADWAQLRERLDEKRWVEVDVQQVEDIRFAPQPAVIRA